MNQNHSRDYPQQLASFYEDQIQVAQACHDRGLDYCYSHPQRVDLALAEFDTAIRMRESLLGKFHNDTAISYFRKACVLREYKRDYFQALVVARRELRISQHLLGGPTHIPIVDTGTEKEWLSERIQWFQEVLMKNRRSIKEEEVIRYSSQLLQTLEYERLGDLHFQAKEWELAISKFNCAMALESSAYARNILEMADLQVKIGDCYAGMDDLDGALEEFYKARTIYMSEFGSLTHARVGHVLVKCASIYLRQKNFDHALGTYAQVYHIYEQEFGRHHQLAVECLQDIKLVTVKEMEELRKEEYSRRKEFKKERRQHKSHRSNQDVDLELRSLY